MTRDDDFNTDGLDALIKAMKDPPVASVGVLGDKDGRSDDNSNATIGAKHEFGDPAANLPIRSWLRMPIIDHLSEYLMKSDAFKPMVLKVILKTASIKIWVEKIGITAEAAIADAFDTGGFNKWRPSIMKFKKNHQTLVETQQLRNSVTSVVK